MQSCMFPWLVLLLSGTSVHTARSCLFGKCGRASHADGCLSVSNNQGRLTHLLDLHFVQALQPAPPRTSTTRPHNTSRNHKLRSGTETTTESDLSNTTVTRTSPSSGLQTTFFSSAAHPNTRPPCWTTSSQPQRHGLQPHQKVKPNTSAKSSSKRCAGRVRPPHQNACGQPSRATDKR